MTLCFTGCGNQQPPVSYQDDMGEHVNLKWYIRCQEPSGFAEVMEAANEYLNEKLNVTLDLVCVQRGGMTWHAKWKNPFMTTQKVWTETS